jgi:hypothetical protein
VSREIGGARVFSELVVVQIEPPRARIEDDIFNDGSKPACALVDPRLGLGREPDHLGVAAVLELEDAVVAPAVLVVANQMARAVGRKRGLPRA